MCTEGRQNELVKSRIRLLVLVAQDSKSVSDRRNGLTHQLTNMLLAKEMKDDIR